MAVETMQELLGRATEMNVIVAQNLAVVRGKVKEKTGNKVKFETKTFQRLERKPGKLPFFWMILCARIGPTPLINPEDRNFSIPLAEAGRMGRKFSTLNCCPNLGLISHFPLIFSISPGERGGNEPTTVMVCPFSSENLQTVYPVSGL